MTVPDENNGPASILKDLDAEAAVPHEVAYFKMAGASRMEHFRSPDSYVLILFEKCSGTHTVDFVTYPERDLQLHISFPGQIHSWNTDATARGHKLILSKKTVTQHLFEMHFARQKYNRCPVIDITPEACERFSREFRLLERELADNVVDWALVTLRVRLILAMVNDCMEKKIAADALQNRIHPLLQTFYAQIDASFATHRTVAFYASELAITANYLNILCKQQTGLTAKELIDQRVVLEAKRLLLGSPLTIKEISGKLGFPQMARFSMFMKARTGLSPIQFRGKAPDTGT